MRAGTCKHLPAGSTPDLNNTDVIMHAVFLIHWNLDRSGWKFQRDIPMDRKWKNTNEYLATHAQGWERLRNGLTAHLREYAKLKHLSGQKLQPVERPVSKVEFPNAKLKEPTCKLALTLHDSSPTATLKSSRGAQLPHNPKLRVAQRLRKPRYAKLPLQR